MTFVLGPAACKGCVKHVYWDGLRWCDSDGLKHVCKPPMGLVVRLKRARFMWTRSAA